jgi:hypothetical protein
VIPEPGFTAQKGVKPGFTGYGVGSSPELSDLERMYWSCVRIDGRGQS